MRRMVPMDYATFLARHPLAIQTLPYGFQPHGGHTRYEIKVANYHHLWSEWMLQQVSWGFIDTYRRYLAKIRDGATAISHTPRLLAALSELAAHDILTVRSCGDTIVQVIPLSRCMRAPHPQVTAQGVVGYVAMMAGSPEIILPLDRGEIPPYYRWFKDPAHLRATWQSMITPPSRSTQAGPTDAGIYRLDEYLHVLAKKGLPICYRDLFDQDCSQPVPLDNPLAQQRLCLCATPCRKDTAVLTEEQGWLNPVIYIPVACVKKWRQLTHETGYVLDQVNHTITRNGRFVAYLRPYIGGWRIS